MVGVSMGSGTVLSCFLPISPVIYKHLKAGLSWALAGARKPQILVTWDPELGSVAHWLRPGQHLTLLPPMCSGTGSQKLF